MELRHLRYFIKAAELLNFTKAAEALYVSQPTLSVQVQQLEQELGSPLFARVGRNVRLTEAGQVFLVRAHQAVRELEEGGKEIDALSGLIRGNICIASFPLYGSKLVSGWISTFNEQHPDVHIKVRASTSEDIETGILAGDIDLGFVSLPVVHADINHRALFKDEIVILASKDHEIAKKKTLKAKDLQAVPLAAPSEKISVSQALGKYFEEHSIQPRIDITYDDGHALIELVKKGKFITFLPKWAIKNDPDICILPLPEPGIHFTMGALWSHLSPASQAFLEMVTQETKELGSATDSN